MTHLSKKNLVIGGAEYIGAHMVRQLIKARCEVVILGNLSTGSLELVGDNQLIQGQLGSPSCWISSNQKRMDMASINVISTVSTGVGKAYTYCGDD